jgi:hypothetical protein
MGQDMNPAVTAAEERAEQPAHQRNDDRAKDCTPEAVDLKTGHDFADNLQHKRVDDQNEQAERYQNEWKAKKEQNWPDKCVDNSKQQGRSEQAADSGVTEPNDARRHEDSERSDEPAKHEVPHGSYYYVQR